MNTPSSCPFAKALLSGQIQCQHAESFHIAERHGIQCNEPQAQPLCKALADQLHQQSRFVLGVTHLPQQMTSNMELRIQCGGINGILDLISPKKEAASSDLFSIIEQAIAEFGTVEALPYSKIAQSISHWKPRRRSRRKD